ncbi:MAG TPA: serine hydrolase [Puia sp.]|jgi:CubicO group peptidase (beta-lactamase class C family)|nr:serine hydrolase [Puia sp.]
MRKVFFFLLLLTAGQRMSAQTPAFITDSLDGYIRQGLKDWNVPGLAIVIVKDGKVAYMKGFGVQDTASRQPVDENTLFMIASNTKLFTATMLSQLEYDKKISLDDKFTKYFPDFSLYEPTTSELLTIRDLLSHRIGTKTFQGDFTFWNSQLGTEEIMKRMRLLKPEAGFRNHFGYCNSCFMAAGQVITKVTQQSWQGYVKDSILAPLGMSHTYTSVATLPDTRTFSRAYTTSFTGHLRTVPWDNWTNLAPAAALISNVSDLSHWLLFQLDSGRYEGRQVMPFGVLQKTREVVNPVSSWKYAHSPTNFVGYGLGLFVSDYNGRQVFWHTGGAAGMVSIISFVPEERLGIAVLTNNDNQNLYGAIRTQILDAYTGMPYVNRSQQSLKRFATTMADTLKTIQGWQARVKGSPAILSLGSYAGHYTNKLYGSLDITVAADKKKLLVKFNSHENLKAILSYMDSDEWLLQYDNIEYGIFQVKFALKDGKVVSLETKESDFVEIDPYVFVKE